jgi:hypothetical protein
MHHIISAILGNVPLCFMYGPSTDDYFSFMCGPQMMFVESTGHANITVFSFLKHVFSIILL